MYLIYIFSVLQIEFIWHTGDISYADDAPNHYSTFYYEKIWNEFVSL